MEMVYKDHDRMIPMTMIEDHDVFGQMQAVEHAVDKVRLIQTQTKRSAIHCTSTNIGRITSRSRESTGHK